VAIIDVGSSKVCTLVGDLAGQPNVQVIGVGNVPSQGIKKGTIIDLDEATDAIRASVAKAERSSGLKISSAHVSIGGAHISATNNKGMVAVAGGGRTIEMADIQRAMESARTVPIPNTRDVIHVVPRRYNVDGQDGIRNPRGMQGFRLEVDAHIVTGAITAIQNLTRCVERAGVAVDNLILQPLASAESVLTPEEREIGVAVADIGGGTTDLALFADGSIYHTSSLAVAGYQISNDIAIHLRTPYAVAEELKARYGQASPHDIDPHEAIEISGFGNGGGRQVPRKALCEIVAARVEEILQMIAQDIGTSCYDGSLPAGLVLTGGSANLHGIEEVAGEILRIPVRIGKPRGVYGLVDTVSTPAFATSLGMLLWTRRHVDVETLVTQKAPVRAIGGLPARLLTFARELLP
jgi:cell division protein FtsA